MKKLFIMFLGFIIIFLQNSCLTSKKSKMAAELKAEQMENGEENSQENEENMQNQQYYQKEGRSMRRRRHLGREHLL